MASIRSAELSSIFRIALTMHQYSFIILSFMKACCIPLLCRPRYLLTSSLSSFIVVLFSNFINIDFISLPLSNIAFVHLPSPNFSGNSNDTSLECPFERAYSQKLGIFSIVEDFH